MAIIVRISADKMEASIDLDRTDGEEIQVEALARALAVAGVVYGIDAAACLEVLQPGLDSHVVARGTLPINGENGRIEVAVESHRNKVGLLVDSGSIDFHERGSYTPIDKGQLLATIIPPTDGTPGTNVRGEKLNAVPGKRASVSAGQGTRVDPAAGELRASRPGDLRFTGDLIEVMDVIRVPGNLDYAFGSIECEGPVRIDGDILPGFHVRAGGDVFVGGLVDGGEVDSGGAVTVQQGVLMGSRIFARGNIKVGYVRESYLESDASIRIAREAVNSTIVSGTTIVISDDGHAMGGRLIAQDGIEVGIAGNPNGVPTTLVVGVNPLKELHAAKLAYAAQRAEAVHHRVDDGKDTSALPQKAVLDHVLERQEKKRRLSPDPLVGTPPQSAPPPECRIKVRRNVHAGVRIRVRSAELDIRADRGGATFQIDAASGQIIQI